MDERQIEDIHLNEFIRVKSNSGLEDVHYSIFTKDLPEEMILESLNDLSETDEKKAQGLRKLKEFMNAEKKMEYRPHQNFIKVQSASGVESVHYSIFCSDLPEDIIQKAKKLINETEEAKAEGIKKLKEFMNRKELKCFDDNILITVLRNCKYNIKKSEAKLEKYLKIREMVVKKLTTCNIKDIEEILDDMGAGIFPYRDVNGRIIFFTRPYAKLETSNVDMLFVFSIASILFILDNIPMASLLGANYLGGSKSLSYYTWYVVMRLFRQLASYLFDFPLSIKKIEVVNENYFARWFVRAFRPILPAKIKNRLFLLDSGYGNMHKIYHPDILPEEFGGNLGPLNSKLYRKAFLDYVEKLKAECKIYNE